jgi:hypothetical protein
MNMPNFLIIGATKSGTTTLYQWLTQHPDIYMSKLKEPHFFAYENHQFDFRGPRDQEIAGRIFVNNLVSYQDLFRGVSNEKAVGEASAMYISSTAASENIKTYIPEVKLIAVLRHPAERAYSSFLHLRRDGREPCKNFSEALLLEEERIRDNWMPLWHYKRLGFYYEQLKHYFGSFSQDQLKVYLYEDIKNFPEKTLKEILGFLDVNPNFIPDISLKYNVSGMPKSKLLHSFLKYPHPIKRILKPFVPDGLRREVIARTQNANLIPPPKLSPALRKDLTNLYRDDIVKLQGLISRDLTPWLE